MSGWGQLEKNLVGATYLPLKVFGLKTSAFDRLRRSRHQPNPQKRL
jgi:hypothetical protein